MTGYSQIFGLNAGTRQSARPAPEWREKSVDGITTPCIGVSFGVFDGEVSLTVERSNGLKRRFRIRLEPPPEGHRFIIEERPGGPS